MRVNLSNIPLQAGHDAYSQVTQWFSYTVRWMKDLISIHAKSSFWLWSSVVLVSGISIGFFEIASTVCRLVNHFLNRNAPYETLSSVGWNSERNMRALALGTLFVIVLAGGVGGCCKKLSLPLSNGYIVLISVPTCFIYLLWKVDSFRNFRMNW